MPIKKPFKKIFPFKLGSMRVKREKLKADAAWQKTIPIKFILKLRSSLSTLMKLLLSKTP